MKTWNGHPEDCSCPECVPHGFLRVPSRKVYTEADIEDLKAAVHMWRTIAAVLIITLLTILCMVGVASMTP